MVCTYTTFHGACCCFRKQETTWVTQQESLGQCNLSSARGDCLALRSKGGMLASHLHHVSCPIDVVAHTHKISSRILETHPLVDVVVKGLLSHVLPASVIKDGSCKWFIRMKHKYSLSQMAGFSSVVAGYSQKQTTPIPGGAEIKPSALPNDVNHDRKLTPTIPRLTLEREDAHDRTTSEDVFRLPRLTKTDLLPIPEVCGR